MCRKSSLHSLRKRPRTGAFCSISPESSRIALMNWISQMDASTASRFRASDSSDTRRPHGARRSQSRETPIAWSRRRGFRGRAPPCAPCARAVLASTNHAICAKTQAARCEMQTLYICWHCNVSFPPASKRPLECLPPAERSRGGAASGRRRRVPWQRRRAWNEPTSRRVPPSRTPSRRSCSESCSRGM